MGEDGGSSQKDSQEDWYLVGQESRLSQKKHSFLSCWELNNQKNQYKGLRKYIKYVSADKAQSTFPLMDSAEEGFY